MSRSERSAAQENAERLSQWLFDQGEVFEHDGLPEQSLQAALGLEPQQATEALDYLESKEIVARLPEALTSPPRFVLKPGRAWPEARDAIVERHSAGASRPI